jgi:hypothetical protein
VNAETLVSTGTYSVGVECIRPPRATDDVMAYGDVLARRIGTPAEADLITFPGTANSLVTLTLVQTEGFTHAFDGARATLFAPTGVVVHVFDSNSQHDLLLPEDGTYVLRVSAETLVSTGDYSVGLESVSPANRVDDVLDCDAAPLRRTIDRAAEVDQYTFSGTPGARATLTLVQTGGFTHAFDGARASLFAPGGSLPPRVFDSNGQLDVTLDGAGTYVLRVNAETLVTVGSYSIGLACAPVIRQPSSAHRVVPGMPSEAWAASARSR